MRRGRAVIAAAAGSVAAVIVFLAMQNLRGQADTAPPHPAELSPPGRLLSSDEFGGPRGSAPDPGKWNLEVGGHGWGNGELQCYTRSPENAALDGQGHLVISASYAPGTRCADGAVSSFTSARLNTSGHYSVGVGRMEVRARVPAEAGTWPAFWALGDDLPTVGWPRSGEIDVMEYVGNDPTKVFGTLHGPTSSGAHWALARTRDVGQPLPDSFHVFTADRRAEGVTFAVDGQVYGRVSRRRGRGG